MHSNLHLLSSFARLRAASVTLLAIGGLFFASCATTSTSEPDPDRNTTTQSEAEFYTPSPFGGADDYWLFFDGEDDVEYSYYLDEDHYYYVINDDDDDDDDDGKKKWKKRVKRGHGYGDHNHIHLHWKDRGNNGRRIHIHVRRNHWADSLQLTSEQKLAIDTAMKQFKECAKESLDSFKVAFKPFRDEFRTEKMRILGLLRADSIGRDTAYVLLDSAIERYETATEFLRAGLQVELQSCFAELDAFLMARLTPLQYAIWVRNRGW